MTRLGKRPASVESDPSPAPNNPLSERTENKVKAVIRCVAEEWGEGPQSIIARLAR